MDKKALYDKAEKALNDAFKVAKESVKVVSEKAGEAAKVTKLLIQKANLEHQVSKQFAQLGSRVYEKAAHAGQSISAADPEIRELIDKTKKLDSELAQVEANLQEEKSRFKQSPKKS